MEPYEWADRSLVAWALSSKGTVESEQPSSMGAAGILADPKTEFVEDVISTRSAKREAERPGTKSSARGRRLTRGSAAEVRAADSADDHQDVHKE